MLNGCKSADAQILLKKLRSDAGVIEMQIVQREEVDARWEAQRREREEKEEAARRALAENEEEGKASSMRELEDKSDTVRRELEEGDDDVEEEVDQEEQQTHVANDGKQRGRVGNAVRHKEGVEGT